MASRPALTCPADSQAMAISGGNGAVMPESGVFSTVWPIFK
jgi:hypothetical protein